MDQEAKTNTEHTKEDAKVLQENKEPQMGLCDQ
jgi:hypothetical protein